MLLSHSSVCLFVLCLLVCSLFSVCLFVFSSNLHLEEKKANMIRPVIAGFLPSGISRTVGGSNYPISWVLEVFCFCLFVVLSVLVVLVCSSCMHIKEKEVKLMRRIKLSDSLGA